MDEKLEKNHHIAEPSLTTEETKLFVTELYEKIEALGYYNLPEGAEIIPYSRDVMGNSAWEVAHGVSRNSENLFYISDSAAGQLLSDRDFWGEFVKTLGNTECAMNLLEGNEQYPLEGVLSLNDQISKVTMEKYAHGDVFTITANTEGWNVWVRTELPTILQKEEVNTI